MNKPLQLAAPLLSLVVLLAIGCGEGATEEAATDKPSAEGQKYLAQSEPAGAKPVLAARDEAQNDEEVTVVGRIGGSHNPWIEGTAAFSIVDPSLKACSDIPGDECPTPWDYCCEPELNKAKSLVKFVDADGNVVRTDARQLLGLKELQTVVVHGRAQRDDAGNLTILADRLYVKN